MFVPGFATTFEDAARRTAQVAYDLNYDGVPLLFSWASKGEINPLDYVADGTTSEWSAFHLAYFLGDLVLKSGAISIDLVAHSMGSRVLIQALREISRAGAPQYEFNEVILAAPDIDRDVFLKLATTMEGLSRRQTVYTSKNDWALNRAMELNSGPRAGQDARPIATLKGLDAIDASNVATDFLGHSYYAENRSVISDMILILNLGTSADKRPGIKQIPSGDSYYYRFRP